MSDFSLRPTLHLQPSSSLHWRCPTRRSLSFPSSLTLSSKQDPASRLASPPPLHPPRPRTSRVRLKVAPAPVSPWRRWESYRALCRTLGRTQTTRPSTPSRLSSICPGIQSSSSSRTSASACGLKRWHRESLYLQPASRTRWAWRTSKKASCSKNWTRARRLLASSPSRSRSTRALRDSVRPSKKSKNKPRAQTLILISSSSRTVRLSARDCVIPKYYLFVKALYYYYYSTVKICASLNNHTMHNEKKKHQKNNLNYVAVDVCWLHLMYVVFTLNFQTTDFKRKKKSTQSKFDRLW